MLDEFVKMLPCLSFKEEDDGNEEKKAKGLLFAIHIIMEIIYFLLIYL